MKNKKISKAIIQLLTIILLILIESIESFIIKHDDNYLPLRPLLQHWSKMKTHSRRITVILHDHANDDTDLQIAPAIFRDLDSTVSVATFEHLLSLGKKNESLDFRTVESGSCVILLCSDISDIGRVLQKPHLSSFWHPENFYILRETMRDSSDSSIGWNQHFLEWALERLWRLRRIYKIAVSIGNKLIRYDPFKYENQNYLYAECELPCKRQFESHSILSIEEQNDADVSQYCYDYRERFNTYPIRISIFRSPTMVKIDNQFRGLDYKYLEVITRKMNVTPALFESEVRYGWKENDTFKGPLGDIVYKRVDVTFNQFFVKNYENEQIEISVPISSDKLCIAVPRAMPIPEHLVIAQTFSPGAWLLVLLGYLVLSLVYNLMKLECTNYSKENIDRTNHDFRDETFQMRGQYSIVSIPETDRTDYYQIARTRRGYYSRKREPVNGRVYDLEIKAGAPFPREKLDPKRSEGFKASYIGALLSLGKYLTKVILQLVQPLQDIRRRTSERALLICSLMMSLILNGVFTSELTSLFTKLSYYEDLHTLEDIDLSGIGLVTESRDLMDDALADTDSEILGHLREKLHYANETEFRRRVFDRREAGFLQRKGTMPLKFTKFQKELFHLVEECPRQYNAAYLIMKGSPFSLRINTLLSWLNSGGFYDKWFRDMSVELKRLSEDDEMPEIRLKLTMRHVAIPFTILFIGILCSSVAFICERKCAAQSARDDAGYPRTQLRNSYCCYT